MRLHIRPTGKRQIIRSDTIFLYFHHNVLPTNNLSDGKADFIELLFVIWTQKLVPRAPQLISTWQESSRVTLWKLQNWSLPIFV